MRSASWIGWKNNSGAKVNRHSWGHTVADSREGEWKSERGKGRGCGCYLKMNNGTNISTCGTNYHQCTSSTWSDLNQKGNNELYLFVLFILWQGRRPAVCVLNPDWCESSRKWSGNERNKLLQTKRKGRKQKSNYGPSQSALASAFISSSKCCSSGFTGVTHWSGPGLCSLSVQTLRYYRLSAKDILVQYQTITRHN